MLAPLEDQARFALAELAALRRPARVHDRQLRRRRRSFFPGRRHRHARRVRHGERSRDVGRDAAVPVVRPRARGGLARCELLRRVARAWSAPRARPASRSSPATPRWWSAAPPTSCSSTPPASASCPPASTISARRARPGDVVIVNGSLGDHGAAILVARNELALAADVASDCQPLHGLVAAMLDACPRRALPARCDARRRRDGAERVRARPRTWRSALDEAALPLARTRCAARARSSASIRCISPTKASWSRSCRADAAERRARRDARASGGTRGGDHRRGDGRGRASGIVVLRPASAATASSTCWSASSCRGSAEGTCTS